MAKVTVIQILDSPDLAIAKKIAQFTIPTLIDPYMTTLYLPMTTHSLNQLTIVVSRKKIVNGIVDS